MKHSHGILAAVAVLLACSGAETPQSDSSRLDLVEIEPSSMISLTEEARFGSLSGGADQFFRIRDLTRTDDGLWWILDSGNRRVAVYSKDSGLIREFGREGSGPGEFESEPATIAVRDDAVVISEYGGRVHVFDRAGTSLRSSRPWEIDGSGVDFDRVSATNDGWVLTTFGYFGRDGEKTTPEPRMRSYWFDPIEGRLQDPTGFYWSKQSDGQWSGIFWITRPFSSSGGAVVSPAGGVLTYDPEKFEIDMIGLDGVTSRRLKFVGDRVPVSAELRRQWEESRACRPGQGECDNRRTQMAIDRGWPNVLPSIGRLEVFEDGSFAILRSDLDPNPFESGDTPTWDFFSKDAVFLGRLHHAIQPHWFGGGILIGVETDDLGVQSVVQYRVELP